MTSMNDCIGIIETNCLSPAIEAADAMLKLGNINLENLLFLGGGQVAIIITGSLGPVQSAIETGSSAAKRKGSVLCKNVIPRFSPSLLTFLQKTTVEDPSGLGLKEPIQPIFTSP